MRSRAPKNVGILRPLFNTKSDETSSMESPDRTASDQVAEFYDQLDTVYRHQLILDIHHGLWLGGNETRQEAKLNLSSWVASNLALKSGERCIDVGSGYGQMARYIAAMRDVSVTAITNSFVQHARALRVMPDSRVEYFFGDWCNNNLLSGEYDAAWAVESMEHIHDLDEAFRESRRVLKEGGRFIVLSWLAGDHVAAWQRRFLIEPTISQNCLAELRTESEVANALRRAGFGNLKKHDLTANVRRTWLPSKKGIMRQLGWNTKDDALHPGLAWPTVRLGLAFGSGAMRYVSISSIAALE